MVRYFNLNSDCTENFEDISAGMWYADYVRISKANSILPDVYGNILNPNKEITREEMMYILYKSLEINGRLNDFASNGDELTDFTDENDISDYAKVAAEYLVSIDIINGNGDGTVTPSATSKRAEVAEMLYNMIKMLNK